MSHSLKIAILGCRGIPNNYGGFEQLAEYLSKGLVEKGHTVTVYNTHDHLYKEKKWNGVQLVHCYNAESFLGTAGQFVYDLNCIRHARGQQFDVLLFLGYTSSSVWGRFFPGTVVISNMDGMEWQRSKYSPPVRSFLQYAERQAVKYSHAFIADSTLVQSYLQDKYNIQSEYIAYGAFAAGTYHEKHLLPFGVGKDNYAMLMARMEPENNIEMILQGFTDSRAMKKLLVIGNTGNSFGKRMVKKFEKDVRIIFAGAVFDQAVNHSLRRYCSLYFHGHSVGGTNPSLLQAMADGACIAAHDNGFNKAVLQENAFYFNDSAKVKAIMEEEEMKLNKSKMTANNLARIEAHYNWPLVIGQYEQFILKSYSDYKKW